MGAAREGRGRAGADPGDARALVRGLRDGSGEPSLWTPAQGLESRYFPETREEILHRKARLDIALRLQETARAGLLLSAPTGASGSAQRPGREGGARGLVTPS